MLKVYNSLFALRKLVKRYEFKQKEKRAPLNHMVQTCFPLLEHLMQQVLQNNSLEAAQIMRMCLKTFWSSTNFALPDAQGVNVNLWFEMIASILNKRLPEASEGLEPFGQPLSIDDRKVWPWWKVL